MKLAIVIPGFQTSAEDWCIPAFTNLARELSKQVELHVFTLRHPPERRRYRIGDVQVHAIGGGAFAGRRIVGASLLKLWRDALLEIRAEHRRSPFRSIIGIWATESGWLTTKSARMLGLPSLVHLAGGELTWIPQIRYGNRGRGLAGLLVEATLRSTDVLTVPSLPMKRALLERLGASLPSRDLATHPQSNLCHSERSEESRSPRLSHRGSLGLLSSGALRHSTGFFAALRMTGGRGSAKGTAAQPKVEQWSLGVDTHLFRPASNRQSHRPFTFITVGSLIPVKGHALLIRGMAALRQAYPDAEARLLVVGNGPLRPRLEALVERLHLQGYVDFVGEVGHEELPALYGQADCFIIGSWHEAQCMATLEAMACGLPWIGPPVGALADAHAKDSPSGLLVGERTPQAFAQAMRTMLRQPAPIRASWGENARKLVEMDYNLHTQSARLLELVATVQKRGRETPV